MAAEWTILHGGALGDLVLTLQLALRIPTIGDAPGLHIISRSDPGDLSACRPRITRRSSDGIGLHWLYGDHDDPPPDELYAVVRHRPVLSALGGPHTIVHHRLADLGPSHLLSLDPQPRLGIERHITEQWQTQLEDQGLLVPKCVHQRPTQRTIGVPHTLRARGRELLPVSARRSRTILIQPGSGSPAKCWPLPRFIEFAQQLQAADVGVCFLLGPVELERWPLHDVAILEDFPTLHALEPDDLVAVLAAADAFLGNDAGPTHLAALLGIPTVVIFGPTSPHVWRPLGRSVQVLVGDPAAHAHDWAISPKQLSERLRV